MTTASRNVFFPPVGKVCWTLLFGLAAAKIVVLLAVGNGYGFHRDEFYYLACGRRPDWGYVDEPPIVPLLGHLAEWIFGVSSLTPMELHGFSTLASAATILLAGAMARELGGGRAAQGFAALAALLMPMFLATGILFQTVVFDQLWWALTIWFVLRALRHEPGPGWLWVGAVAGAGLETKDTMALLGLGLAATLTLTGAGRSHLRTPWPWLGGAIAGAFVSPNLLWQHAHGWPTAEFIHNSNANVRETWTWLGFLGSQFLYVGLGALPLLVLGAWRMVWQGNAGERSVGWIIAAALAALLVLHGKPYYLGPVYPALAAVGGVAWEEFAARRRERRPALKRWLLPASAALMVFCALPLLPAALPLLPRERLPASWVAHINGDFAEETGWPELASQALAIFHGLPTDEQASSVILTVNYGESASIEHFAQGRDREIGVICPHNNYWLWGPGGGEPRTVIIVGASHRPWMEELFGQVEQSATIDNPLHIANEERGRGIYVCRQPKRSLRDAWPELKSFQ